MKYFVSSLVILFLSGCAADLDSLVRSVSDAAAQFDLSDSGEVIPPGNIPLPPPSISQSNRMAEVLLAERVGRRGFRIINSLAHQSLPSAVPILNLTIPRSQRREANPENFRGNWVIALSCRDSNGNGLCSDERFARAVYSASVAEISDQQSPVPIFFDGLLVHLQIE